MLFEEILTLLGDFDRYQRRTYFLVCLMVVPAAWHVLAQVFIAAEVDHWCDVQQLEPIDCSEWNLTQVECTQAKKDAYIPKIPTSSSGKVSYEQCLQYDLTGIDFYPGIETANITNATLGCDNGWMYDTSQYKSTVLMKFDLVCGKKNVDNYVQSVFFAGFLCGSFIFGSLADWIGRRRTLFICLAIQATMGLIVAFSPAFWFFTLFRFILAAATIGVYFISFVLGTEFVGPSKRILIGALVAMAFAVGYMILAILAVLIREWWVLQLVISLPIFLLIPLTFLLPESARWLMSRGKYKRAEAIIRNAADVNGVKLPENLFLDEITAFEELEVTNPSETHHRTSFLDLFRTPNMRVKTINIMFNWFVNSLVYHGLSLSTSTLGSNDYVAFFVSGAVEIPSYILMIFVAERWGRRPSMCTFMIIGGFACLISTFMPSGAPRLVFAMIGKFCVALSFALIYIFSAELFPTPIRSIGIGVSNVACFAGSIFTPILLTLADVWLPLPYFVFGLLEIIAGVFAILLPETLGEKLPDTLEEGEAFGKYRFRSLTGRMGHFTPGGAGGRGKSRPSSLWMQSPTYEKVVENIDADDNKGPHNKSQAKNGGDSLWIATPSRDVEAGGGIYDPEDEEEILNTNPDDEQEPKGEMGMMDLSTFKEQQEDDLKSSSAPSTFAAADVGVAEKPDAPTEDINSNKILGDGDDSKDVNSGEVLGDTQTTSDNEEANAQSGDIVSDEVLEETVENKKDNVQSQDIKSDEGSEDSTNTSENEEANAPSEDISSKEVVGDTSEDTAESIEASEDINSTEVEEDKDDISNNEDTDKLLGENNGTENQGEAAATDD